MSRRGQLLTSGSDLVASAFMSHVSWCVSQTVQAVTSVFIYQLVMACFFLVGILFWFVLLSVLGHGAITVLSSSRYSQSSRLDWFLLEVEPVFCGLFSLRGHRCNFLLAKA